MILLDYLQLISSVENVLQKSPEEYLCNKYPGIIEEITEAFLQTQCTRGFWRKSYTKRLLPNFWTSLENIPCIANQITAFWKFVRDSILETFHEFFKHSLFIKKMLQGFLQKFKQKRLWKTQNLLTQKWLRGFFQKSLAKSLSFKISMKYP